MRLYTSYLICSGSLPLLPSLETHRKCVGSLSKDHQYPWVTIENCRILTPGKSDLRKQRCACRSHTLILQLLQRPKSLKSVQAKHGIGHGRKTSTVHWSHYNRDRASKLASTQTLTSGYQGLLGEVKEGSTQAARVHLDIDLISHTKLHAYPHLSKTHSP